MRIIWHSVNPMEHQPPARYGTMTPGQIAAHLDTMADQAGRELQAERRALLLDGSCATCLESAHGACTGRVSLFGAAACSCQIDQHETLLAHPATPDELADYL